MLQRRPFRSLSSIHGSVRLLLTDFALVALALAVVVACGGRVANENTQNSQTHWLETCETSADCGTLECSCGLCTRPCSEANSCASLDAEAVCVAPGESSVCTEPMSQTLCLAGCQRDADCDGDTTCREGACVPGAPAGGRADGAPCLTADECESGVCQGQGCDDASPGTCGVATPDGCREEQIFFCTCEGETISSSSCAGVRYEHEGECEGDTPKPDGAACLTASECESGVCEGQGCDDASPGVCAGSELCADIAVTYCTCEGETIHANACAGTRYEHTGECETAGDPGGDGCDTNEDCASGICEGQGCGAGQGICASSTERECTADYSPVCTCDGVTEFGSSSCRGFRYEYEGECEIPGLTETVILPNGDTIDVPVGYEFETLQGIDSLVGTLFDAEGEVVFQFDGCGLWGSAVTPETGETAEAVNTSFVFARSADDSTGLRVTFADRSTNFSFEPGFPEDAALEIARTYTAVGEPCIDD